MEQESNFELFDEAINACNNPKLKQILQNTKNQLQEIYNQQEDKSSLKTRLINFEVIKNDKEMVEKYYNISRLEKILDQYFELQSNIENESIKTNKEEYEYLQRIMHKAIKISWDIIDPLNDIFRNYPKALTAEGYNFMEVFKYYQ